MSFGDPSNHSAVPYGILQKYATLFIVLVDTHIVSGALVKKTNWFFARNDNFDRYDCYGAILYYKDLRSSLTLISRMSCDANY